VAVIRDQDNDFYDVKVMLCNACIADVSGHTWMLW